MKSSWEAVPVETVKKLFLYCAITTATDGSDDENIHCFTEGQPCEEERSLLEIETQKLLANSSAADDNDPFVGEE